MARLVFDTNTVVSAMLFTASVPAQALAPARLLSTILMSEALADEFHHVLRRPRFDRYARLEERNRFLDGFILQTAWVEIIGPVHACRDPRDDKILELAWNGNAGYIVTGDADLLVMNPFRGIAIVRPAELPAVLGYDDALGGRDEP